MSEKKIEAMHMSSNPSTASNALRIETKGQRYEKSTSTSRLSVASTLIGRVSDDTVSHCTIDRTPARRSRLGYSKRRW